MTALLYGRTKDIADLERLFAALPALDLEYVRSWLDVLPEATAKRAVLADLIARFRA